jgi:hypothetical protein
VLGVDQGFSTNLGLLYKTQGLSLMVMRVERGFFQGYKGLQFLAALNGISLPKCTAPVLCVFSMP